MRGNDVKQESDGPISPQSETTASGQEIEGLSFAGRLIGTVIVVLLCVVLGIALLILLWKVGVWIFWGFVAVCAWCLKFLCWPFSYLGQVTGWGTATLLLLFFLLFLVLAVIEFNKKRRSSSDEIWEFIASAYVLLWIVMIIHMIIG